MKEVDQLHHRNCFTPIDLSKLTPLEKKKAQAAMLLLSKKTDGTVKGRCVYEGSKTRPYFTKEETTSRTASTEGIFMVWFGLVWFGLVWFGLVWFGLVWFGLVWFGLVW